MTYAACVFTSEWWRHFIYRLIYRRTDDPFSDNYVKLNDHIALLS